MAIHQTIEAFKADPLNRDSDSDFPYAPIMYVFMHPHTGECVTYFSTHEAGDMNMMNSHIRSYVFINEWILTVTSFTGR